jgi:protein-tyrosine-phosphatase/predicted ATP-grasp superfamily ATP-dependent carboligase
MVSSADVRQAKLPGQVLVLDADQASALAVVRSLARRGLRVHVASAHATALARHSRHTAARWEYPDPLVDAQGFVAWLESHLRDHAYDMVVPVTERTVVPLAHERARFGPHLIAVADAAAIDQVIDKQRTAELAVRLGVRVPRAESVEDTQAAVAAAHRIGFPIVVKPARSVGHDGGRRVQLTVSYAFNERELSGQVESALRYGPVLLQEHFPGDGIGIELIASQGETRYLFQHRRLHEVPLTGGGSSLRISEAPDPVLAGAATALMRALRWHGVAMVEFKRNPATGDYRLIEVNGRFWGSLPLAVAAGADFPAMLHQLMTTGDVGSWPAARAGTVARQLARDIDWIEQVLRRQAPTRLVRIPPLREVLRDTLLVFSPRHHFDVQSWSDPWPGLVDAWRIVAHQGRRVRALLQERRALRESSRHAETLRARLALAAGAPRKVLFLCYGNINRSALAHAYALQRFGPQLMLASAGFHSHDGRPADPVMQEVAARMGVSLADWSSHTLTAKLVNDAELILAMEVEHLHRLEQLHPGSRHKACLLDAQGEIPDPYGKAPAQYEQVARRVQKAVDTWFRALGEASPVPLAAQPTPPSDRPA